MFFFTWDAEASAFCASILAASSSAFFLALSFSFSLSCSSCCLLILARSAALCMAACRTSSSSMAGDITGWADDDKDLTESDGEWI